MAFTREELDDLFRDNPKDGVEALYLDFRHEIAGYIRCVGHGALQIHDIRNILQDVFVAMIEVAKKPTFDPNEPMKLVYTIAFRKTKQFLRDFGYEAADNLDNCLEYLAEDFKNTDVELRWKFLGPEKQQEFYDALMEIIAGLSDMQRLCATAFVDCYKDIRGRNIFAKVRELVVKRRKEDITVAAVKRNWHEARKKIEEQLNSRGFEIFSSE
jgi:DNA-directed RNA polymerase specialized sigma24 family protein